MSHTKGEWKHFASFIYSKHGNICALSEPRQSKSVEYCPLNVSSLDWKEAMDNGKLIAAAPELLEACELAIVELDYHNWRNTLTYNLLQTVIAKAKGEAP